MQHTALRSTAAAALALASASLTPAQIGVETFSGGNLDGWQIWFAPYNYLRTAGGNPGEYFELDDVTSGPATCQFLNIFSDRQSGGHVPIHAGDWRAAGVNQVSLDVNIQAGRWNGILTLLLVSDPGTPLDAMDDCIIRLSQTNPGPPAAGWTTLTFDVDASQTTAPAGWSIDTSTSSTGCTGATLDQTWNTVIQDVDEIRFRYDTTPGFCAFTSWIFGIDNIVVGPLPPIGPGASYCTANTNSAGTSATMDATGSNSVASNSVTLIASALPSNSFAFFLTSRTQGFAMNPAGSQGNLCLGGSIGRFVGAGQIQNSGAGDTVQLALDLARQPTPNGLVQVLPGDTWNFTCWYRDVVNGAATSNFADGYSILFQ
ncbi:MAG: hypothetical protein R3F49_01645 [Planctomycetota bacterium]